MGEGGGRGALEVSTQVEVLLVRARLLRREQLVALLLLRRDREPLLRVLLVVFLDGMGVLLEAVLLALL